MYKSVKKNHVSNTHPKEDDGQDLKKICEELHEMCRFAQKNYVPNAHPRGSGGKVQNKDTVDRNSLKCADLHRKLMFLTIHCQSNGDGGHAPDFLSWDLCQMYKSVKKNHVSNTHLKGDVGQDVKKIC